MAMNPEPTQPLRFDSVGAELERICDAFEQACRTGESPRIEDYLNRAPESVRATLFRELLYLETEYRRKAGETPSRDEYARRFSDFATLVDTIFRREDTAVHPTTANPDVPRPDGADPLETVALAGATTVCGRFQIVREHARGGLGEVYVAQDGELRRPVALKRIQERFVGDPDNKARFLREAEITGNLEHPGVVPVYGLGVDELGRPYYAMRFIRGETFETAIKRFHKSNPTSSDRGLELRKLLRRFLDVCNAIDYAHSKGVLHRDLKPANIMLGKHGETLVVDWGLAKTIDRADPNSSSPAESLNPVRHDADAAATQEGLIIGTPAYMSPEQAEGRQDDLGPATDVYSLGAVLYALLTGKSPVEEPNVRRVLERVRKGEIVPPHQVADVSRPLSAVCMKAMSLEPENRYPLPRDLVEDLEHWLADEPVSARPETWSERQARWMRRHRTTAQTAIAALALVAVVAVGATVMIQGARTQEVRALRIASAAGKASELLEGEVWDRRHVESIESLIAELDALAYDDTPQLRKRMPTQLVKFVEQSLAKPVVELGELDRMKDLVGVLDGLDAPAATRLRTRIASREGDWQSLISIAPPYDTATRAFELQQLRVEKGLLFPTHDGTDPTVLSGVSSAGRVQIEATWNANWEDAPAVGLILNADGERKYAFLLCLRGFSLDPVLRRSLPSFATARTAGEPFEARIIRIDGETETVLRSAPVEAPSGELTMRAGRVDDTLTFELNRDPGLSFVDMFPIGTKSPGKLGLYWPKSVGLSRWEARRQALPPTPSFLEQADEMFAHGDFKQALELYERQAADFTSHTGKQQARYKQAVCLTQLGRSEEAIPLLEPLVGDLATSGRDEATNWPLRAAFLMWRLYFQEQNYREADRTFDKIETQTTFRFAEVARLVPAEDRRQILMRYRHDGQRFRLAYTRQKDLPDLERAVAIDQVINEDAGERWMTRWRLLDAYRAVGGDQKRELNLAGELMREAESLPPRIHTTILRDYYWLLLEQKNARGALANVDEWLLRGPQFQRLLSERARIKVAMGDEAGALADLETFLAKVPADDSLDYYEYAEVCLMKGLLLEKLKKDAAGARAVWMQGLQPNVPAGVRKFPRSERGRPLRGVDMNARAFSQDWSGMLLSLTGEATEADAVQMLKDLTDGAGLATIALQKVLPKRLKPALMRDVMARIWTTPHGRQEVWKLAFKQFSFRDHYLHGIRNMLQTGIELGAFGKAGMPEGIDAQLWQESEILVNLFNDGKLTEENMVQILDVWEGELGGKDSAVKAFGPLATTAAYIFGCRCVVLEQPDDARTFFEQVIAEAPAGSKMREDAAKRLAALPKGS